MEKTNRKVLYLSIITISIAISLVIIVLGFAISERTVEQEPWILQSYGNNVALYNGEEVIEVYGAIVLDTLPEEDKRMLDNGIVFLTREEAVMAIEDYDGWYKKGYPYG